MIRLVFPKSYQIHAVGQLIIIVKDFGGKRHYQSDKTSHDCHSDKTFLAIINTNHFKY